MGVLLMLAPTASAQLRCEGLFLTEFSKKLAPVLGEIRTNLNQPIVSQCGGTCYIEAAAAVIDSKLSTLLKRPVTISRADLFMKTLKYKMDTLARTLKNLPAKIESASAVSDIISGGNLLQIQSVLAKFSIEILEGRSQTEVYRDNKRLKYIFTKSGELIYSQLRSQEATATTKEDTDTRLRDEFKTMTGSILEDLNRDPIISERPLGRQIGPLTVKIKPLLIEIEPFKRYYQRITPNKEKEIIELLAKGELSLSYFHIKDYVKRKFGRDGFLDLPNTIDLFSKAEITKKKRGGAHAIALVDVILGEDRRIEYFVVRNTWGGGGDTDQGYHYISVDYLAHYGFQIYDLEIKDNFEGLNL